MIKAKNSLGITSALILLCVIFAGTTAQKTAVGQAFKPNAEEDAAIREVKRSPDIAIEFNNFTTVPLYINQAKVKEIGQEEFQKLTGFTKDSPRYTTFPNVTLKNNTDQRITAFVLMVGNKQTRQIRGVRISKTIEPHGTYSILSREWVRQEKRVHVAESGKVTTQKALDLRSEKMWWPAGANDLVLRVAEVHFENGSKWQMDESMDW